MHKTSLFLLLLAALPQGGCYLYSQGKDLEQRVIAVEARQNEFSSHFDEKAREFAELTIRSQQQLAELQALLDQANASVQRSLASTGSRSDSLEDQLRELRGQLEETQNKAELLRQELEILRQDMDLRFAQPAGR